MPRFLLTLLLLVSSTLQAQVAPTRANEAYAQVGPRALRLDYYAATSGTGPRPVVVWLHDGGWLTGDRTLPEFVAPLVQRGIAVVSIDYRLTSEGGLYGDATVTFPAQIHDVKAAIRYVRAHAADLGIDPARIGAWGSSAGGHLAALAGTSGNVPELEGSIGGNLQHSSRVQAVVDYYGPTDLLQLIPDVTTPPGTIVDHDAPGGPGSLLIGYSATGQGLGNLRANVANATRPFPIFRQLAFDANPITHVDATDPPFLIAHGTADNQVAIRQSERLRDALGGVGANPRFVSVPGAGHGGFPENVHAQARDFLVETLTAPAIAVGNPVAYTGLWYEPSTSGQGLELQVLNGDLLVAVFYGHRDSGANLFLLGTRVGRLRYGESIAVPMTAATNGRFNNFNAADIVRTTWGTLALTLVDCDHANATLTGADGTKVLALVPLARVGPKRCD